MAIILINKVTLVFCFKDENYIEKMKVFLNYNLYNTASKKLHRLMIWSYVKEKILENL